MGVAGPVCGRPAVELDKHGRPVCDLRQFQNVFAHLQAVHRVAAPAVPRVRDPLSAEPDGPPVALAAQDPPSAEADSSADVPDPDRPFTVADARAFVEDAVSLIVNSVESVVKEHCAGGGDAAMAQGPGVAVHPVGLCDDGSCAPCRSQRRDEHAQARRLFAGELDQAIEWTGRDRVGEMLARDGSDALADVLENWRDAGRPEPVAQPANQIQVVSG